jgi:hypothetical protein
MDFSLSSTLAHPSRTHFGTPFHDSIKSFFPLSYRIPTTTFDLNSPATR